MATKAWCSSVPSGLHFFVCRLRRLKHNLSNLPRTSIYIFSVNYLIKISCIFCNCSRVFILDKRRLAGDHSYSLSILMKLGKGQKRSFDRFTHNFQTFFELKPYSDQGDGKNWGKYPYWLYNSLFFLLYAHGCCQTLRFFLKWFFDAMYNMTNLRWQVLEWRNSNVMLVNYSPSFLPYHCLSSR